MVTDAMLHCTTSIYVALVMLSGHTSLFFNDVYLEKASSLLIPSPLDTTILCHNALCYSAISLLNSPDLYYLIHPLGYKTEGYILVEVHIARWLNLVEIQLFL